VPLDESCIRHDDPLYTESVGEELGRWRGEDPAKMPRARAIIMEWKRFVIQERPSCSHWLNGLRDFYSGRSQWEEPIATARNNANRPVLTVNMLPMLVAAAISAELKEDPAYSPTPEDYDDLICAITARNKDANILLNYELSSRAELAMYRVMGARVSYEPPLQETIPSEVV
jgi:hypothetical protein